jgi:iron complex outermembrane receptor protein
LKTEQNVQSDINLEYNSHFEFFVNGFIIISIIYIYTSPTGRFKIIMMCSIISKTMLSYGGEIGLHFHPHPLDWLHYETSFETVTGKKQNGDYCR